MLIYDDIRFKLNNMKPKLDDLKLALDLEKAKTEIEELEKKAAEPEFWNDPSESQKVLQRTKQLKDKVAHYAALYTMYEDVVTTIEMAEEMEDESLFPEVQEGFVAFEKELDRQTLSTLLSGEYDRNNAILSFHAGAGGTEAMDWTSMLIRMYQHWADSMGFKHKILDFLDGEDAGIKSAEMLIEGATMSITTAEKLSNHAEGRGQAAADCAELVDYCRDWAKFEQNHIEALKKYL